MDRRGLLKKIVFLSKTSSAERRATWTRRCNFRKRIGFFGNSWGSVAYPGIFEYWDIPQLNYFEASAAISNWKVNRATVFRNFLSFLKPKFMKEKSQQPSTNTRSRSVSFYYFTKVFFNFKVFYHLSCETSTITIFF
jgi:hypothetical protein